MTLRPHRLARRRIYSRTPAGRRPSGRASAFVREHRSQLSSFLVLLVRILDTAAEPRRVVVAVFVGDWSLRVSLGLRLRLRLRWAGDMRCRVRAAQRELAGCCAAPGRASWEMGDDGRGNCCSARTVGARRGEER